MGTRKREKVGDSREKNFLPDYCDDWKFPVENFSADEIEACFYYEYARESPTILRLAERLSHFTPREIRLAERSSTCRASDSLSILHPALESVLRRVPLGEAFGPQSFSNLKDKGDPEKPRREPAFRSIDECEFADFIQACLDRSSKDKNHLRLVRWHECARYIWGGTEDVIVRLDWNQGTQAIEAAMERWWRSRKAAILRFAQGGGLPNQGRYFHAQDKQGAKHPRQQWLRGLRALAALRLLSRFHWKEAFDKTRKVRLVFGGRAHLWHKAAETARVTFKKLFFSSNSYLVHLRRAEGLPDVEEPISYRRFQDRRT